ncbi:MAG: hypothetical protein GY953_52490 [bacterium]|nr:hypothetical protein [bacterium]
MRSHQLVMKLGITVLVWLSVAGPARPANLPLDELLVQVGDRVEIFGKQFSSIACTETVEQVRMSEKGRIVNRKNSIYDYLIFMQLIGNELSIEESRVLRSESKPKKRKRPSHRSLLVTNGFSIMLLVFHPHFQSGYMFTRLPDEKVGGVNLRRIDFEQVQGARSPSVLQLKEQSYPLEWKGSAWIDPSSGSIVRMKTGLKQPMREIGLHGLDSEVSYSEFRFQDTGEIHWLPGQATIEARSAHQRWLNSHRFSDYKRFAVKTEVSIGDPR